MTDDRSLERAARSWLENGPTQAPDRAVEAALLRIQTLPQERDLRIPWRLPKMITPARVAAAAVIGVLLVGTFLYLGSPNQPAVGGPEPSPTTSLSPDPASSASGAMVRASAPVTTLGDWQAMSDIAIPNLFGADQRLQLSIDWQDGQHTWIQTTAGRLILKSETLQAPADEIHLITPAADPDALGCGVGDVGRYRWSRSTDGMFLTMTAIEDACANRRDAMARVWVHSLSAVTDGGAGVMPFEDAWLKVALPHQRFGLGGDGYAALRSMDVAERSLVVIMDPFGIDAPCAATRQRLEVLNTPAALVAYAQTLPGFTTTTEQSTVAGLPATHLTITPKGSTTCQADGTIVAFHSRSATTADGELAISADQAHSTWVVEGPSGTYLFMYEGDAVTPDQEAAVISSLQFLDELPTP